MDNASAYHKGPGEVASDIHTTVHRSHHVAQIRGVVVDSEAVVQGLIQTHLRLAWHVTTILGDEEGRVGVPLGQPGQQVKDSSRHHVQPAVTEVTQHSTNITVTTTHM